MHPFSGRDREKWSRTDNARPIQTDICLQFQGEHDNKTLDADRQWPRPNIFGSTAHAKSVLRSSPISSLSASRVGFRLRTLTHFHSSTRIDANHRAKSFSQEFSLIIRARYSP